MNRRKLLLAFMVLVPALSCAESMRHLTDRVFSRAEVQFRQLASAVPEDRMPVTFQDGMLKDGKLNSWTSGFFPGSLWLVYEYSGDERFRTMAEHQTSKLRGIIGMRTHHDIGFQVNSSFGNMLRLTGDTLSRTMVVRAAEKLAGRFSPTVGAIRSWDNRRWQYPVIIDNMMNLEILLSAWRLTGDDRFRAIAECHAVTTMRNHFREDGSSWHLLSYDPSTGTVIRRQTVQGYADCTAWSRGQSWGLYGYTMMYRYTGETKYLSMAARIADYILGMLPRDGVPEWDFNAPGTRNAVDVDAEGAPDPGRFHWKQGDKVYRDASAGAITASALVELSTMVDARSSRRYRRCAERILRTLASGEYLAREGTNGGFLLRHSVTNLHEWKEVDVPLTYADYYFLEALLRLKYMKR